MGYPNLTDNDWLYGGDAENIITTIHNGRTGAMAAWQQTITEEGVRAAAEYVLQLSGNQNNYDLNPTQVAQGEAIFNQQCVLCHGPNAKGMYSAGAPNLTDSIWLYGGTREDIRTTIRHGRAGVMPAWASKLGNERVMLLAAYVYSLSDHSVPADTTPAMTATTATTDAEATADAEATEETTVDTAEASDSEAESEAL